MSNRFMCFTTLPKINNLLCLFATVQSAEIIKTSLYNAIILKCRRLIFENSEVLARPHFEGMYGVYLVFKEEIFEQGLINKYLDKYNLKANSPFAVPRHIYEECCLYTITAKLAPKWNLISNYLVSGRDFLTNSNPTDCIHFQICINDEGDATLIFKVSRIKLPPMSFNKIDLPENCSKQLELSGCVDFKDFSFSKTIRVLPSLKTGNILSIKKKLTESSAIKNYQQIKRHWKNTYGYRLPESEDEVYYFDINFFERSPIFTYPSVCVRPYEPVFLQRIYPAPVVGVFMSDLLKMVPTVLGERYPVPINMANPSVQLNNIYNDNSLHPNASNDDIPIGYQRKMVSSTQNSAFVTLPTQRTNTGKTQQKPEMTISQLISELDKSQNNSPITLQASNTSECISQTQEPPIKKIKHD